MLNMSDHSDKIKSIYIDQKSLDLLDKVATSLSISRSALIRILINQYCKDNQQSLTDIERQIDIITGREACS